MAPTTPPTFSIGQKLAAASLNTESTAVTELQTGSAYGSTSWSPTFTASGTAPSGQTTTGQYVQFGKIVMADFTITIGAGAGTGTYMLSLPVTANSSWVASLRPRGEIRVVQGSSSWIGWAELLSTTTMRFGVLAAFGAGGAPTLTQTVPGTFASGNTIVGTITYAAA